MSELKISKLVEYCQITGKIPTEKELSLFILYDKLSHEKNIK